MKYRLGCIGCGNMGQALIKAIAPMAEKGKIAVCDKHPEKTDSLAKTYGVSVTDALDIAKNAKFVMLGVKPQVLFDTLDLIKESLSHNPDAVIISMAAAVSIDAIAAHLTGDFLSVPSQGIIRIMPNTPVSLGEGVIQYTGYNVADTDKEDFCRLFSGSGLVDEIPEGKIDVASALSGCGPAFVYLFAEALADGAVACGLPRDKAIRYAARTLIGAGKMIEENGHISDLKDAVCSPGGTTIEGVRALERGGLRSAAMEAVIAAYEKTKALQK